MPRLPSGRYVVLSKDRLLEWARETDFSIAIQFSANITKLEQLTQFVDLVCYQHSESDTHPYKSPDDTCTDNLRVSDVSTAKCSWSGEDRKWFIEWLQTPEVINWFESLQLEFRDALRGKDLPKALSDFIDDPDNRDY